MLPRCIPCSEQVTQRQRLPVLRKDGHVAREILADFLRELGEGGGTREIDDGVWFQPVAVSTGHDGVAVFLCEADGGEIFLPGAKTVNFQSVDARAELKEELPRERIHLRRAYPRHIPEGMVQHDQDRRIGVQHLQQIAQRESFRDRQCVWTEGP